MLAKLAKSVQRTSALRTVPRTFFSEMKKFENNFLSTTNVAYIESLYEKWLDDKSSVSPSFNAYFQQLERGADPQSAYIKPPAPGTAMEFSQSGSPYVTQQLKLRMLIERYRSIGHQFARVDPLDISRQNFIGAVDPSKLTLDAFEFTQAEKQLKYNLRSSRDPDAQIKKYTVQQMEDYLREVYCRNVGYEYTHVLDKGERDFLKHQIERNIQSLKYEEPSKEEKQKALDRLCKDQTFIDFLASKFATMKRFGVEGLNTATVALEGLSEQAAKHGVKNLILGMAHRGRLNTLHCVFDKPAQQIFKQFLEKSGQEDHGWASGDVKYHLGFTTLRRYGENSITLSMMPNPSHLQAVNPLIYGSVRSIMKGTNDMEGDQTLGVLVHGDAAIAGQGIVYESAEFQDLTDYTPKGIIHIVMNNQIGFTTNPSQARSTFYCTQIAKVIGAPVFHVNANQPAVLDRCIQIAVAYRQKFKKDIFIDIVGYRRYGHNEQDQPAFTQPKMYEKIKNLPTAYESYAERMIQKKVMTAEQIKEKRDSYMRGYEIEYQNVLNDKFKSYQTGEDLLKKLKDVDCSKGTGVQKNILDDIFKKITTWPQDFNIHPTIKKIYEERKKNYENNEHLDWATMESLAYGTLLNEGFGVRLSGEDVERGTFSHRHALISDQNRDVPKFNFQKNVSPKVTITNSHLSEYGVLGFEYGYSITDPNYLTIWEAQFGDFANGAHIMIDNYIVGAESKWGMQSGLVMNLPHGMDGQGPQHSSARLERFLQLSDDNCDVDQNIKYQQQLDDCNIQVLTCSITSNIFHALRRQLYRDYRKPLIMFNSKKLLKFKGANRPVSEIVAGTQFQPVLADELGINPKDVKKVLICNGQFYYELKAKREELKRNDIAIIRIEQIAPFPVEHLKKVLEPYGNNVEYSWAQEEHENYGAWNFVYPRLKILLKGQKINFFGRNSSASTANGKLKIHKIEEENLLKEIFA